MSTPAPKIPGTHLTVVIRDDSPVIHCGDCPTYRSVRLRLTAEQLALLHLRWVGISGGSDYFESISKVFIEPIPVTEETTP